MEKLIRDTTFASLLYLPPVNPQRPIASMPHAPVYAATSILVLNTLVGEISMLESGDK